MSVFAGRAVFPTTFADPHGNGRAGLTIAVYRRLTYTDGVTVLGSTRLTSATAAFTSADEGKSISAENFPSGATIEAYVSATEVDLSVEATAGGSGASFIIAGRQRSADLATVYTDRLKSATTSNPYVADVNGNTAPLVDPGDYDAVTVHGVTEFTVLPDHAEPLATAAVEEAMLAFNVATQTELDAVAAAKQDVIPPGTYVQPGEDEEITGEWDFSLKQKIKGLTLQGPRTWADPTHPHWGAVGDGVEDDSGAASNAAASLTNGGRLIIPADATLGLASPILGQPGVRIEGEAAKHDPNAVTSGLKVLGANKAIEFIGAGGQAACSGFWVRFVKILGGLNALDAIHISNGQMCGVEYCHIDMKDNSANAARPGGGSGLVFDGLGIGNAARHNRISGGRYGVLIRGLTTTTRIHSNRIEDADATSAPSGGGAGLKIEGTQNGMHSIKDNLLESHNGHGLWIVGPELMIAIEDNWFEGNNALDGTGCDMFFEGSPGNILSRGRVVNNRLNSAKCTAANGAAHLRLRSVVGMLFDLNEAGRVDTVSIDEDAACTNWHLRYSFSGTKTFSTTSTRQAQELYQLPAASLQGQINLAGQTFRDTSAPGSPTYGFLGASPESNITASPGSIRPGRVSMAGVDTGTEWVKLTGTGNTGWRRFMTIGIGWHTLTADSTTPSVSPGSTVGQNFKTANTVATTITNFVNGADGQVINVVAKDANTTIAHGANVQLKGAANKALALNETMVLVLDGSVWREV